jgi:hypothetical protein
MAYTLRQDDVTRNETLVKDGVDVNCAYQNSHLVPSQMGQIQLMRLPCSLSCAHAELSESGDKYSITCGCEKKTFDIQQEQKAFEIQTEKKSPLIIV